MTAFAGGIEKEPVKVVAHRGAHTDGASENSIAALRKAMDANYYGVELDVQLTADGEAVVFHDGDLKRMTEAEVIAAFAPSSGA